MYGQNVTAKTPQEYLASLEEPRKSQLAAINDWIIDAIPDYPPFMISGMIGYGPYHYKYTSGREGDWCIVGLANNKSYISLYLCAVKNDQYIAEANKSKLPNASIGKSCIRYRKFEQLEADKKVLMELIKQSVTLTPQM